MDGFVMHICFTMYLFFKKIQLRFSLLINAHRSAWEEGRIFLLFKRRLAKTNLKQSQRK